MFMNVSPISLRKAVDKQGKVTFGTSIKTCYTAPVIVKKIRYNKHCNRVVILNLELVQFWLFLAAFGTPLTRSFLINKKKNAQIIYLYNRQYIRYNIIWGIVFPEYFNQKLFLFVDFYLSPDKLARKIYLSGRFCVRVGHGNSTPLCMFCDIWLSWCERDHQIYL
jgi:hypothetical protein